MSNPVKVVILCGSAGTRLREETEFRPKPMVNIGSRPILWHIMKYYSQFGCSEFWFVPFTSLEVGIGKFVDWCLDYHGNVAH